MIGSVKAEQKCTDLNGVIVVLLTYKTNVSLPAFYSTRLKFPGRILESRNFQTAHPVGKNDNLRLMGQKNSSPPLLALIS